MNKKIINTLSQFIDYGLIHETDTKQLEKVAENFSISLTKTMYELIDKNNLAEDPVAQQYIPTTHELLNAETEVEDPIGDNHHTKVKGIIHRYPDRCLFTPILVCPVYCRFCFRREKIANDATLTPEDYEAAFAYIHDHKNIWEVILTGGDPLILKPKSLAKIIDRLNEIKHVEIIRIHTRVPVVDPGRINDDLIHALNKGKTTYIILHANHPQEFSEQAIKACRKLIDKGFPILSQTVLLKGINDNIETLSELMKTFVKHRIKPYYLHHGDLVKGTKHFRTSIKAGQNLVKALRARFSGLCQPTYVLDIPHGFGKVPISECYLEELNENYLIKDHQEKKHFYPKE